MATSTRRNRPSRSGFGAVTALPSGRYRARFTGPDGIRHAAPCTFPTRAEADAYLVKVHAELLRGNGVAVIASPTTVAQYMAEYLAEATSHLRPRTLDLYQRSAARWIIPAIGEGSERVELGPLPLSALSVSLVRRWHGAVVAAAHRSATGQDASAPADAAAPAARRTDAAHARAWAAAHGYRVAATGKLPAAVLTAWTEAGRPAAATASPGLVDPHAGRSTAAQAYRLLRTVLAQAVRDGLIATNPAQVKGASTAPHPERKPLEVSEVAALAEAVAAPYRAAVLVAAWSGLRPGELFALTRADIAADGAAVSVSRTLVELPGKPVTTGPPKSAAGRRTVALPSSVAAALVEHLDRHTAPEPEALVFTTPGGGPVHGAARSRAMSAARQAIGRPDVTWHHLRHTGATLAAISGATQAELQRRIGHSTTRAAALYQHASTTRDQWIATQLDALAGPIPPTPQPPAPQSPAPEPSAAALPLALVPRLAADPRPAEHPAEPLQPQVPTAHEGSHRDGDQHRRAVTSAMARAAAQAQSGGLPPAPQPVRAHLGAAAAAAPEAAWEALLTAYRADLHGMGMPPELVSTRLDAAAVALSILRRHVSSHPLGLSTAEVAAALDAEPAETREQTRTGLRMVYACALWAGHIPSSPVPANPADPYPDTPRGHAPSEVAQPLAAQPAELPTPASHAAGRRSRAHLRLVPAV